MGTLEDDLARILNCHSEENKSDTPDFILAMFLIDCLKAWNATTNRRDQWWGHKTFGINKNIPAVAIPVKEDKP